MSIQFKTQNYNLSKLTKSYNGDVIDLSELNMFEATKTIIMMSTYFLQKSPTQKIKYKVSTPNIENILKDIPFYNKIELV